MRRMKSRLAWMLCASLIFAQTGVTGLTPLCAMAEMEIVSDEDILVASDSDASEELVLATSPNAEGSGKGTSKPQELPEEELIEPVELYGLVELEDTGDFVVTGDGEYGTDYEYDSDTRTLTIYSGTLTVKGMDDAPVTGRIAIKATASNAEPNITIEDLNLTAPQNSALEVGAGASLTLTVSGENSLKGAEKPEQYGQMDGHGIHLVRPNASLTIEGDGALTTEGGDSTKNLYQCGDGIYNELGRLELKANTINVSGGTSDTSVDGGCGIAGYGAVIIDSCNLTVAGGNGGEMIGSTRSNGGAGITGSNAELTIVNSQVEISGGTGGVCDGSASQESMNYGGTGGAGVQWDGTVNISIENSYVTMTGGNGGDGVDGGNGGTGGMGLRIGDQSSSLTIDGSKVVMQGGAGGSGEPDGTGEKHNGKAKYINENSKQTYSNSILLSGTPEWTDGSVVGSVELPDDMTIGSGQTLTITDNGMLTIPEDRSLIIESGGTLTIERGGMLTNNGTLHKYGTIIVEEGGTFTGGQAAESTGTLTVTREGTEVTRAYSGDTVTLTAAIRKKESEQQTMLRTFSLESPNTVDFYLGDSQTGEKLNTESIAVTDGKATIEVELTGDLWTPDTAYTITAVYHGDKELLNYDMETSLLLMDDQPAEGVGYTVDYGKETVVADPGYEISTDGGATYVTEEIPAVPGATVSVRIPATVRKPVRENILRTRPSAPVNLRTEAASSADGSDGKVCGCLPGEYQIRRVEESGFGAWTDAAAGANGEITGLKPGSYEIRFKASQSKQSFAGNAAEITVNIRETGGSHSGGSHGGSGNSVKTETVVLLPETEGSWFRYEDGHWGMKTPSGQEIKNSWVVYQQHWYYLEEGGRMATGLKEIGGKHYYFLKDIASEGRMLTGWVLENGMWYYGSEEQKTVGENHFGWVKIRDKWYFFGPDGILLTSTRTPDGYYVDSDGVWIP